MKNHVELTTSIKIDDQIIDLTIESFYNRKKIEGSEIPIGYQARISFTSVNNEIAKKIAKNTGLILIKDNRKTLSFNIQNTLYTENSFNNLINQINNWLIQNNQNNPDELRDVVASMNT